MAKQANKPLKTARRSAPPPLASAFRSVGTYASMAPGGARLLHEQQRLASRVDGSTNQRRARVRRARPVAVTGGSWDLDRRRRATTQISREASNATAQNT